MNAKGQCNPNCYGCRECVFLPELRRELSRAASIRRDPFSHIPATLKSTVANGRTLHEWRKDWLKPEPKRTLAASSKALGWTSQEVTVGTYGEADYATFANCAEWLKARREALGLSNDLQGSETTPEAPVTVSEAPSPIVAPPLAPDCYRHVDLTQADYAALLSMTGDMFQNIEPYGWYEAGRNALLVNLAPCLMPSSQNAMTLAEYESLAA